MRVLFTIEFNIPEDQIHSAMDAITKANIEIPGVVRMYVAIHETADAAVHVLTEGPDW
jgi:hypothetical protein